MNKIFHSVQPWIETWSDGLWRASIAGGIAIAVVWIVARSCKVLSPRIVCWMWRLVCVKMLVAIVWAQPVAIAVLSPTSVNPTSVSAAATVAPAATPNIDSLSPPTISRPATTPIDSPKTGISFRDILFILWAIGVLYLVTIGMKEWIWIRAMVHSSDQVASSPLIGMYHSVARQLGIRRIPALRQSELSTGPLLAGVWRPTIILPAGATADFSETELRLMLGHELAHLKRRDLAWNWLPTMVGWLFFFHPLVWLLRRCWFESQEAACDEVLIQQQSARPSEYGRLLLKVSTRWPVPPQATIAAAGVLGAHQNLANRIVAMTHVRTFSKRRLMLAAGAISLIAALAIIPWRVVAQEQKLPSDSDKETSQDRELLQSAKNLNQIVSALQKYDDAAGHFPPAKSGWGYDRAKGEWYHERPYLSWRVVILPFLGQTELFNKFKLDEPWNGENNRKLLPLMPAIYRAPGSKAASVKTNYLGVIGPNSAFPDKGTITVPEFTDGTSRTIMLVEVPDDEAVEWTKPEEFPAGIKNPMKKLVGLRKEGFLSAFADAGPEFISEDTSPEMLQNLLCRNDGKPLNQEDWVRWIHFVKPTAPAEAPKADTKPGSTSKKDDQAEAEREKKLRSPKIIIAQHVLLWDGRIVTWDEILTRFRLMRREGPFHPSFKDTTGLYANKVQGWQFWHDRIMGVYKELFQPDGVSFGSISPRGSKVYDAIVTEDDLTPDPALGRKGRLLDVNGKPAAGAQVILLPIEDILGVSLDGTKLRDPYDECWTTTNDKGEFTIYPKDDEFFIATLHPSGFALQRGTTKNDKQLPVELNLQPWATVTFSSTGETENQSGHISCKPLGDAQRWPEFVVYEAKTKGKPMAIPVPAGKIDVSRSLIIKEGTAISLPFESFSLKTGEEKTMEIKPASKEDKARALQIYDQLHHD